MRKQIISLFSCLLFIINFSSILAQEKLYEFESAYVKKKTTTTGSSVEVVTIDESYIYDHGKTSVTYKTEKRNIKSVNKTEESNSVIINNGDWIITYDPKTKAGTKRKNILAGKFKNLSDKDAKKMAAGMKEALNASTKDLGTEVVAGKKCKVTETSANIAGLKTVSKTWTYGNYVMKSMSESFGNKVEEIVIEFKEGIKFDESKIKVPKGIKLKEVKY
jgi:hypothetical protein